MLNGQYLCGSVQFQINLDNITIVYQCHCSLCRKQSGTHANFATLINTKRFQWTTGEEAIMTYRKDTGFTSSFCQKCGSAVPNILSNGLAFWIPLGLIDNDLHPSQKLDFHMASKANWENMTTNPQTFSHLPEWNELKKIFKL